MEGPGKVSFQLNRTFQDLPPLITQLVDEYPAFSQHERASIADAALWAAAKEGPLSADAVRGHLNRIQNEYRSRTASQHTLVSHVSVPFDYALSGTCHLGVSVQMRKVAPTALSATELRREAVKRYGRDYEITPMRAVVARVQAQSIWDAFERAEYAVDLLRGAWNFVLNRPRGYTMSFGRRPDPVNQIRWSSPMTVHTNDTAARLGDWWVPSESKDTIKCRRPSIPPGSLGRAASRILRLVNDSPSKALLEPAMVRYCRALDEPQPFTAFLHLWSLLEFLTGGLSKDYEVNTRRAAAVAASPELELPIVQSLRRYRNQAVHAATKSPHEETIVHQTRLFVERLLAFMIYEHHYFASTDQLFDFLDLPPDPVALEDRLSRLNEERKLLETALRLRRGESK